MARRHVFIGGRDRGLAWLGRLAARGRLPAVVYCLKEDDHETEKLSPEIVRLCAAHGVPCRLRRKLRKEDEDEIVALAPDLTVVMGWRTLLSDRVLAAARFGTVGLHESPLPEYRGFAPVNWAVLNGEATAGVTMFHLTSTGVDDGDVVGQRLVPIGEADTADQVYRRVAGESVELLDEFFDRLLAGTAPRMPQDHARATYTCARAPADGLIDWAADTGAVFNRVRALTDPYPGAFTHLNGTKLTVWRAEPVADAPRYVGRIPGRVVRFSKADGWAEVLTGDGVLRVLEVQPAGGPRRPAADVLDSVRATLGARPADLLDRIGQLEAALADLRRTHTTAPTHATGELTCSRT